MRIERRRSNYDAGSVAVGIVHIGLGAFHRAHQAAYLESTLSRHRGGTWGISAANIRSNSELPRVLTEQGCRYHIAEYSDRQHVRITEINAIREALYAGEDNRELLERMTTPTTRIVSLTISEKGYRLSPATGELMLEDTGIAHDLVEPANPRTAPGLLLEALRRRRALAIEPFTVLCCDNMPDNGNRVRRAVVTMAEHLNADLARWLEDEVAFPCNMVDRIVPAVSAEAARRLDELIGYTDPAAVATEAFSQWVIEDVFPAGRPDWEHDGVEMVADITPFETMKLRLLNGAHSLLAYVGLAHGKTTVAEAIADPALRKLVRRFFAEAGASLETVPGTNLDEYTEALIDRFDNDALEHSLSQIAMDGSQKIPQRWLDAALINLEHGRSISATAEAVAAWAAYVRGKDQQGRQWPVDDPMADKLAECHRQSSPDEVVAAILGIRKIFPESLAERGDFRIAVRNAFYA